MMTRSVIPSGYYMGTMTIDGAYASAAIFTAKTHTIEDYALSQLQMICDNMAAKGARIRVMPDVHPGKIVQSSLSRTLLSNKT